MAEPLHVKKDFLQNVIHYNGQILRFEQVGPSTGVLRTEDTVLIAFLNDLADKKRKGVRRISAEQYDAIKKNSRKVKPSGPLLPPVRVFEQERLLPKGLRDSSPAAPPAVVKPPTPVFTQPSKPAESTTPIAPVVATAATNVPPAPPVVAAPPVKPRTMKKSQLKAKEAKPE